MKALKEKVCLANLSLVRHGLSIMTWGNVSGVDRERGIMVIKPSGMAYDELTPAKMAVVRLRDGEPATPGTGRPSSDMPVHRVLYLAFPGLGGVAHTHSRMAVAFAQACRELPCLGTTHADHFYGSVPVTRMLTEDEIANDYETRIGEVIVDAFRRRDPMKCPAALVAGHGPFTWGRDAAAAVENSVALEAAADTAAQALALNPCLQPLPAALRDKHFFRKHGPGAYYGQR